MGFYLLGRDRDAGEMQLISDVLYTDRQSALDALSQLSSDPGYAHRDCEVFVADLDQAVPVLVVASAAPAVQEPVVEAKPEPPVEVVTEAIVVEEPIAEAVLEAEETPSLAHALKNATDSLESEGIVAPESVGPASTPVEAEAWPWEDSGATPDEAAEPEAEETEVAEYVPDPFEEPAVDAGDLVSTRGEEDVELSRTVVMGAYADDDEPAPIPPVAEFDESMAVEPVEALPSETAPEAPALVEEDEAEIPGPAALDGKDDDEITGMLADLETIEQPAQTVADTSRKEDDNGVALTCEDCVYVNTCPNKDGLQPNSCGNFQWKSV